MADLTTTHNKQQHCEEEEEDEDEDEDYMGDLSKFIPTEPSEPPSNPKKPQPKKTLINSSSNNEPSKKKPKFNNWQEQHRLKKERKQLEEDEQTLKNTQSAIPQSNIGFKLLKKMGYTPGKGIGKEGREEPIGIEIRRGRAGIGREDPAKERVRREKEQARRAESRFECRKKVEEEMVEDFGVRKKMQWRSKRVRINFEKAKAVIDQLENREPVVEADEEKEDGGDEEEEEEVITEEDLLELLVKLREEHRYCLFCGCQYESMQALLSNCPGLNEDDH